MEKNIGLKKLDTKSLVLCSLFASLVCVGAFIKIPGPLVPFTMQWFFTAMAGLLLGSRLGFYSVFAYIFIGLMGAPVFTKGGGISYVLQPTFGYIIGFCVAAYIIGKFSENKQKNFKNFFIANMLGLIVVYTIGFIYLYAIMVFVLGKNVVLFTLLKGAVLMFIPTDILSAILSASISTKISKAIHI